MGQLKRKSLGGSLSPDGHHDDVPSKRARVNDIVDQSVDAEQPRDLNESDANEDGHAKTGDAQDNDSAVRNDSPSSVPRRPAGTDTASVSPRKERSQSISKRRESSSRPRSPEQDRRPDYSRRRSRSPVQSPDQRRRSYEGHRRRDGSPPRRERRESETGRRETGFNRNSRPGVVNKDEEKKRGKRLFGGLLSTLSQTTTNSQQKRRQEIEKRQQEKAAKQKTEDDLRRNERLAKLDRIRKIEQVSFDEQVVSTVTAVHACLFVLRRLMLKCETDANPPLQHACHGKRPSDQKRAKACKSTGSCSFLKQTSC